jgi:hypothetical protein
LVTGVVVVMLQYWYNVIPMLLLNVTFAVILVVMFNCYMLMVFLVLFLFLKKTFLKFIFFNTYII